MKSFLSVKSILVVLIVALVTLGSGTALASRQSAVSTQDSQVRTDAATIVTSSVCTENNAEFTVYGSGWDDKELILLSVVRGAGLAASEGKDVATILYSGSVNDAGAFQLPMNFQTKAAGGISSKVMFPGAGLFTLEALGLSGRLATTPVLFVDDKCPGAASS